MIQSQRRHLVKRFGFGLLIALALLSISPGRVAAGDVIPPGFDLFETDPTATRFSFEGEFTIPGSFFDQGCDPFSGMVSFKGEPLGQFMTHPTGTADTVVERKQAVNVPPPYPSTGTAPIELVALSLMSVSPITVSCPSGPQVWDVQAVPSPSTPSSGKITITKLNPDGGTFESTLTVLPLFTFTRHSDLQQRVLDVGRVQLPQNSLRKITLRGSGALWVHTCPPIVHVVPGLNDLFCASADANGKRLTREQARLAKHGVLPAQRRQCFCQ